MPGPLPLAKERIWWSTARIADRAGRHKAQRPDIAAPMAANADFQ
jgi:hypothetical protein